MKFWCLLRFFLVGFFAVLTSQGTTMVFHKHLAIEGRTGITMKNPSLRSAQMEWRSEGNINIAVGRNTRKLDHQHIYKNRLGTRVKADGFHAMMPSPLDIFGNVTVSCKALNMEHPVFRHKRKTLSFPGFLRGRGADHVSLSREETVAVLREGGLNLTMEKGELNFTEVYPERSEYEKKSWTPSKELRIASSVAMAAIMAVVAPAAIGAMGITSTVAAVATKAAMTACVSTLADKTLTHEGKVGKALAEMTRGKELLGLGKSVALSTVAAVGASEISQATIGAPLLVREGAQYGLNVGVRLAGDHGHGALERHLMGALVDKLGEHASREIGALYRSKALENAGLGGEGKGLSEGGAVEGGTEGIGYLEHKILHALSGAAQGALLDLKNPAQSALWGAIGAAGAEVAMEAVYDPVARSKALIENIMKRQELSQLSKEQFFESVQEILVKELRADVERTRDLVRAGLSLGALAAGGQAEQMSMMDGTASRATDENFFFQAIGIGLAVWETVRIASESWDVYQKEGAGAALAHAGAETAKEVALAVTGAKAVKLAGKAIKMAKASKVVGEVCEQAASYVPEAVKTAGALVEKGVEAAVKLDKKLDKWTARQVQKLAGRATVGAGQQQPLLLPAPQRREMVTWPVPEVLPPLPAEVTKALDAISHVKVDVSQWKIIPKVKNQLVNPNFVEHFGYLSEEQLVRLSHNPGAKHYVDKKSDYINIIQHLNNRYMRITMPQDELKVISTGYVQEKHYKKYISPGGRYRKLNSYQIKDN